MATKTTKAATPSSSGTAARTAAGLAPLALALLLQQSVLPGGSTPPPATGTLQPAVCADDIGDFRTCHTDYPTGCTKAGRYDAALNLLKNQLTPPATPPVQFLGQTDVASLESKLPKGLSKSNHGSFTDALAQLGEGHVYGVHGYLYYAQKGGTSESSNCQLGDIDAIDFHIGIGFDPAVAAKLLAKKAGTGKLTDDENASLNKTSMIVEMTPHYRFQFKPDWTLPAVQAVVGHQVRVTGLLLVDNEHFEAKDDCAFSQAASCWRATVWELHPVTQFQFCNSTAPCADDSPNWVDIGEKTTPPKLTTEE